MKWVKIVSQITFKKKERLFLCYIVLWIILFNMISCASLNSKEISESDKKKHHLSDGTFKNLYPSSTKKSFSDLIKWWWNGVTPKAVDFELSDNDPQFFKKNKDRDTITWIGHSTLLIQYGGITILTDPHLTQRASPVSFAGPKRYTNPGLSIEDLPDIDIIVISHNHYDHLYKLTVEKLFEKQSKNPPHVFVPLRLKKWFEDLGIENVTEQIANDLLALPKKLGTHPETKEDVFVDFGRYGPYVKCGKINASMKANDNPLSITLEEAIDLIKNRKAKFEPRVVGIDPKTKKEILIKIGRFGPYVTDGKKNVSLKGYNLDDITLEECLKLLSEKK